MNKKARALALDLQYEPIRQYGDRCRNCEQRLGDHVAIGMNPRASGQPFIMCLTSGRDRKEEE